MYAQFANPAHRAATAREFDAALATLCDAFADDPVWGGWAFPERARAAPLRRALFALWLEEALPLEWVRVTGRCEAVALWYPPGSTGDTDEYRRALHELSGRLGAHAENFRRGSELFAESQPAERC